MQWGRKHPTRFLETFVGLTFTDHQKWVFLNSWVPKVCVWVMSRSSGKAVSLNTLVYRYKKPGDSELEKIPLSELKTGDYILDESGCATQVIHMNPIIFDNVYEVEFSDGEKIKCNGEHLWQVYNVEENCCHLFTTEVLMANLKEFNMVLGLDEDNISYFKKVNKISKTNKKEAMRCITVSNKSGCFVCGEKKTVTHNSFLSSPMIMARSLLFPNHNTYILAPSGSQSAETFKKLESLAKGEIASVLGTSSFFLDECVRMNSKADPFTHDKSGHQVKLYNGSTVNSLNSVAKNIVGIRSKLGRIKMKQNNCCIVVIIDIVNVYIF